MKPAAFKYHSPSTLDEALATLARVAPDDGRVLAGGQSLVPAMALRLAFPQHLVDINGIAELRKLQVEEGALVIGAGVRHAAFHEPVVDGPLGVLLARTVRSIAHYPIRTRGTFCGSVANADPASEWCVACMALDATLIAASVRGRRKIAARDFFAGMLATTLEPDEMLVEVHVPLLPATARVGFYEFSRRAGDFGIAIGLAVYELDGGVMRNARVAVGGVEAHARRVAEGERLLDGRMPEIAAFTEAAAAAAAAMTPYETEAETVTYKRDLTGTVVRRALEQAAGLGWT